MALKMKEQADAVDKTVTAFVLNYVIRSAIDKIGQLNSVDPVVKTQTVFTTVKEAVAAAEK